MTQQEITAMSRGIVMGLVFTINVLIGYLFGHHFHSFLYGYLAYSVLTSLDSISIKLADIRESLKGGR